MCQVERYKNDFCGCDQSDRDMRQRAADIYLKYIVDPSSNYELNISSAEVRNLKNQIGKPDTNTFDRIQTSIFKMVELDCYPR